MADNAITLRLGDALDFIGELKTASVDCVLVDPPYSINTKSDGSGKLNPWADRINAAFWYKEWFRECFRVLKPTGSLWSFINWRSFTTYQKVADDISWPIESLLVWDKQTIGPGGLKGLRPSYEFVALWAKEKFSIDDRGLSDIQRFKWASKKPNGHPAEKPASLIRWILEQCTRPGDLVVDLFSGSGTTGAVCQQIGRSFWGCEIDPGWHEYAVRRIQAARMQLTVEDV